VTPAMIPLFVLVWAGVTLIIDGWTRRRRRPSVDEAFAPLMSESIADEARAWLDGQGP
jgi:hypothetical protein